MHLQLRVPGKLMIAGEYAVLEPHQSAVVAAVNQYITVTITPSQTGVNTLHLPSLGLHNVTCEVHDGAIRLSVDDARLRFVERAMWTALHYAGAERQVESASIAPFCLTVESGLEDHGGRKYGLGSSACVVVGVLAGLLQWVCQSASVSPVGGHAGGHAATSPSLPDSVSAETLYKLAAVAHFQAQGNGSGADVAAAVFGGWIRYASFQPEWLEHRLAEHVPLRSLIDGEWPYLVVERLPPPPGLEFRVGWTGEPASTAPLVRAVQMLRNRDPESYQHFLARSGAAVELLLRGHHTLDPRLVMTAMTENRQALAKLGHSANIPIETPGLAVLADLAERHGGAGKPSGAGGGDCGIALVPTEHAAQCLEADWRNAGIEPLPIQISPVGVEFF